MNFFRRLGLGLGKMELQLTGVHFHLGQCIDGELLFHLQQPTPATAVWIEVEAFQTTRRATTTRVRENGQSRSETNEEEERTVLFSARLQLDGEKTYAGGVYPFRLKIPHRLQDTAPKSDLARLVEVASMFRHGIPTSRSTVQWELRGRLEIPWSAPLRKSVSLQIFEGHQDSRPEYSGSPGFEVPNQSGCPACGGPIHRVHGCIRCQSAPQPAAQLAGSGPYAPPPAAAQAPRNARPRFCTSCGDKRDPENSFCENCGKRFEP